MKSPLRLKKLGIALCITCTLGISSSWSEVASDHDVRAKEISELIYKSALFPFFQEDYFSGMTALHVAQEKGLLDAQNSSKADILLGSLYLSYGMYEDAEAIFQRLADTLDDPITVNRIWLQLGEIYYQTQSYEKSKRALEYITEELPLSLRERKTFIHGNTLLELSEYEAAVTLLSNADTDNTLYYYGLFNIGIKLLDTEQTTAGYKALEHLIHDVSSTSKEIRALKDKARLTLGYHELKANNTDAAMGYFSAIPLESPYALWGLYGLGRSAYLNEDYKNALAYWLALEQHTRDEVPIIEAHLATSQLYFRLGALQQSLEGFDRTIDLSEQEITKINTTIEQLMEKPKGNARLVSLLLLDETSRLTNNTELELVLNRPDFIEMLASTEFNHLKQSYQDLEFYKQHLLSWKLSIEAFNDIVETRKQAFNTLLPTIVNRHESMKLSRLKQNYALLNETTLAIMAQEDAPALANDDELKAFKRLAKIRDKLKTLQNHLAPEKYTKLYDKYTLLAGILNWNLATDFKPRLRKTNKGLKEIKTLLEDTQQLDFALKQAQRDAPATFANYEKSISNYANKIVSLIKMVDDISGDIETETQTYIVSTLEQRKENLDKIRTHARFAVAQIYDLSVIDSNSKEEP